MRNSRHKRTALLLAALLALLAAGCGGGGDETTDATEATAEPAAQLSKDELISQGDAICAEVNAAVGALGSSEGEVETAAGEEAEKVASLYTGMVQSLQNLGTPEGDEDDYAKFSEAAEELAKVEGEVELAAEREDTLALEEAETDAGAALEEFETQAAAFGFSECSEGPSAPTTSPGAGAGEEAGGVEEGGLEPEAEYEEPEYEEAAPEEEVAPETGGAGGGVEEAPEAAPEGGGSESGGVGPG